MIDPLLRELSIRHPEKIPPRLIASLFDGVKDTPPVRVYIELIDKKHRVINPDGTVRSRVSLKQILQAVCFHYGVSSMDMASSRRTRAVVLPRQVFMYLGRTLTTRSLPEIGRFLGNRDHTTILYGSGKIEKLKATCEELSKDISAIRARLGVAE